MRDEQDTRGGEGGAGAAGGPVPVEVAAWREFCHTLEALGDRLLTDEFPETDEDRVEGFSHLARLASCWLAWTVTHGDARFPTFQRHNDLVGIWGGPNVDNAYHHARIDPRRRYRIRGRMHSCEDFILAVRAGFMHRRKWGTLVEVTASEIGIGRGDEFELLLGGDPPDGDTTGGLRHVALPDEAVMVSIREYYFDWQADEPATFVIDCLDDLEPPGRLGAEVLASRLAEAAAETEDSVVYWNRYMKEAKAERTDNSFAASLQVAKGLASARYAFCFWELEPGQALYVETTVPNARYWSLQLYTLGWFEPPDVLTRVAAINHVQTDVDPDGLVRAAVSAEDPSIANWLDTGGRRSGLLTLRWFWPEGPAPEPVARVVPIEEVRTVAHESDRRPDAEERRAEVERRREHLLWRFRT